MTLRATKTQFEAMINSMAFKDFMNLIETYEQSVDLLEAKDHEMYRNQGQVLAYRRVLLLGKEVVNQWDQMIQ